MLALRHCQVIVSNRDSFSASSVMDTWYHPTALSESQSVACGRCNAVVSNDQGRSCIPSAAAVAWVSKTVQLVSPSLHELRGMLVNGVLNRVCCCYQTTTM